MPLTKRLKLMEDLCEGLGYAHSKELIHRDIKPANLIIDSETKRLKVLDFGVVRTMQFSAQRSVSMGAPIGTYCYMSPEQTRASRTLDNRSDIFSCGLVFYELLSNQRAFPSAGDVSELIGRIQRDQPPVLHELVPDLDLQVEAIVYKAIEKVPAKRYADLSEMQRDLENVRRRLEEEERRQAVAGEGGTILQRPKPVAQQVTDLVDRANSAFDTGDDHAVIEFTDQILLLVSNQPDALELKERSRERIRTKLIEASINEARALLARGEITSAGQVLNRPEIDTKLPAVRKFTDDLSSARRGRRLALLIRDARRFLDNGALQEAIERAEAVLEVDPANGDARRIEEQARAALSKQHDRLDAALVEADKAADEEGLDEAIRILTPFESDPAAAAKLAAFRKELQELQAHDRAVASLLTKARDLIAAEKFIEALDVLSEGKTLDPENEEITELRRWVRPIVKALGQADDAIRLFEKGSLSAAEEHLQPALDVLNSFKDTYPSIQQRLSTAEAAWISALEREQERKRKEQEREQERLRRESEDKAERERQAALDEQRRLQAAIEDAAKKVRAAVGRERFDDAEQLLARMADLRGAEALSAQLTAEIDQARVASVAKRVKTAIAKERFEEAERELKVLVDLAGGEAAVGPLRNELAEARVLAFDRAAASHRDSARLIASKGDLEGALVKLREFAPEHPTIEAEIKAVGVAIQKRDEERARAERKRQEDERLRQEAERKRLEEERVWREAEAKRQEEERIRTEAERKRQEEFRLQREAEERKRQEELRLQREAEERKKQEELRLQREAEERKRQEELKAKKKLEERVDKAIQSADRLFADGKQTEALESLAEFEPDHPRIDQHAEFLRKEIQRLAELKRAEDEKRRKQGEAQRLEQARRDLLARAGTAAGKGDYATALDVLSSALGGDLAGDAEVARARAQTILDLRGAYTKDRKNPALQALVGQYDPWFARRPMLMQTAGAVAAVVLAVVVYVNLPESPKPTPPSTTQPSGPATAPVTPPPATTTIPAPPPKMAVMTVDFRPWARVRIIPADSSVKVPEEAMVTPFVITLPAGEYTLRAENDGLTNPTDVPVKLVEGEVRPVSVQMPGFRADAIVDQLLKGR